MLAVVELYSRDRTVLSERLIRLLTGVGYELGRSSRIAAGSSTHSWLTPRQLEILQLAAEWLSRAAIAERLTVSVATVKSHFEHIYTRLGVSDRSAAVAQGLRHGLIL